MHHQMPGLNIYDYLADLFLCAAFECCQENGGRDRPETIRDVHQVIPAIKRTGGCETPQDLLSPGMSLFMKCSKMGLYAVIYRRHSPFGLGEIRDRSFENQRYRASGLNLVVAAIVLWNTVYLERAITALRDSGKDVNEELLPHLSPLGWEHINLTDDYIWRQSKQVEKGKFRPLRTLGDP